jgi:UDP-arabinose 4-epimerase
MTTILVTGGAGYIGSHTCKALRAAGFVPVSYDNLERGNPEAVQWGELELGDLADIRRLHETFTRHRPATVVHFAALAYVGESNENPAAYYRNNVGGIAALLDATREYPRYRFFEQLRRLRGSGGDSHFGRKPLRAGQSLRRH